VGLDLKGVHMRAQLSGRESPGLGLATRDTAPYLRNLPSLSSSRKLIGYSCTHPAESKIEPQSGYAHGLPVFLRGLGAALTVMRTRMRTARPSMGLADVTPGSGPNSNPCAGPGSLRSNVAHDK
jgi:hypothetical protein